MFKEIENRINEILELPEEYFIFGEMIAYLVNIPKWKFAAFYVYTFTYIRQRDEGKDYRICLKWATFPYVLRYRIMVSRLRNWLWI